MGPVNRYHTKDGRELWNSERLSSSCSTSGNCHVTLSNRYHTKDGRELWSSVRLSSSCSTSGTCHVTSVGDTSLDHNHNCKCYTWPELSFVTFNFSIARGRWFSPGTPASSTTKTGRHDIAEILLKVALNTINPNQSNQFQQKWPRDDFCIIKRKLVSYEIYNIGINLMWQIILSTYCS